MRKKIPLSDWPARFWSYVDRSAGEAKCWPWQKATRLSGYGSIQWKGRMTTAHRVAFELAKGEIEAGLIIRHTCDNPICCNPSHLLSGTFKDNAQDAIDRGRYRPPPTFIGEEHPRSRLTDIQVRACRQSYIKGESIAVLAGIYGVGWSTMDHVVKGDTWRHLL